MAGPASGPSPPAYVDTSGHLIFEVKLARAPGAKLGIEVLLLGSSGTSGIIIDEVATNGLVDAWNQRSVEPYRIHSGDIIIRVNGVEGDGEALSSELLSDTYLHMAVLRVNYEALRPGGKGVPPAPELPPQQQHGKGGGPGEGAQHGKGGGQGGDPMQNLSQRMMQQLFQTYQQQLNQLQQQHMQQQLLLQQQQQMQLLGLQRLGHLPPNTPALPMPSPQESDRHQRSLQGHGGKAAGGQLVQGGRGACGAGTAKGAGALGGNWPTLPSGLEPPGLAPPSMSASAALAACLEHTFEVYLVRPKGAKLGVGVQPARVGQIDGLSVRQISPGGAVDEWNQTCRGGYAIREGDTIVCINGISLNPQLMTEQVQTRHELLFTVLPQTAHPLFNGETADRPLPS